jgi:NOL1/NOP2/fmu family ribosome biogenesis protein
VENEGTITAFLESHTDFSLLETKRVWPHQVKGEGHFAALLEKETFAQNDYISKKVQKTDKTEKPKEFEEFQGSFLAAQGDTLAFSNGAFVMNGINLYFQRVPLDLRGLRVARSGWFLGECVKGRFVPSQALAMGLKKEQVRYSVELSEDDANRYLRGESLHFTEMDSAVKPWVLMCHGGFPLGWARLVQGRLKNNLPVGWVVK